MRNKKEQQFITTHKLGKYILENGTVPTPLYTKSREYERNPKKTIKFNETSSKVKDDDEER